MRISPITLINRQNNQASQKNNTKNQNFGMFFKMTESAQKTFFEEFSKSLQRCKAVIEGKLKVGVDYSHKNAVDDRLDVNNRTKFLRTIAILNKNNNILFTDVPIQIESVRFEKAERRTFLGIRLPSSDKLKELRFISIDGTEQTHGYECDEFNNFKDLAGLQKDEELIALEQSLLTQTEEFKPDKLKEIYYRAEID